MYHTRKPFYDDTNFDHTRPPQPFPTSPPRQYHQPTSKPHKEDYMAVIPYGDLYKLFEMLNKHTKPYDNDKMRKKIDKRMKTTRAPLPPPTTKRTKLLQPKEVKRTVLKGKKKKKTVHVSVKKP